MKFSSRSCNKAEKQMFKIKTGIKIKLWLTGNGLWPDLQKLNHNATDQIEEFKNRKVCWKKQIFLK